jgi:hypothetical protein
VNSEHGREPGGEPQVPTFAESSPSASSGENEEHWPEQRPMTPADFDRPFTDEHVEHNRAEPRPAPERTAEQPSGQSFEPTAEPAPRTENEDKSSGERKRGWWKRVLS